MENSENSGRLSNKVLSVTCPCGIVFETYDTNKMYHSNKCKVNNGKKRNRATMAQRLRLKKKKLRKQKFSLILVWSRNFDEKIH